MPYNTAEKRHKNYLSYGKEYSTQWRKDNRERWNKCQKLQARRRRARFVEKIKSDLLADNFGEENSLVFKAGVILIYCLETGIKRECAIAKKLGYKPDEVKSIFDNWKKYDIYQEGVFYVEEGRDSLDDMVQFTLICLVGSGELVRITLEDIKKQNQAI